MIPAGFIQLTPGKYCDRGPEMVAVRASAWSEVQWLAQLWGLNESFLLFEVRVKQFVLLYTPQYDEVSQLGDWLLY
jgi:hypothetical protein